MSEPLTDEELAAVTVGGLKRLDGPVELADPDPSWPDQYDVEAAYLRAILGDRVLRLEHVGSTSVPGLPAKPILDVQISVLNVDDHGSFAPALERAGYLVRVREPGHVLYRSPERDVHVHLCAVGSEWERRHLVFRDWLRTHPDDRDLYADVKRRLLRDEWESMIDYSFAKTGVITTIMQRAEAS